ncbi:hypothetical protein ETH_00038335 [Eimeria tenella]|uniref:Uncharacterized protein n=1 Tax=Eimeria tenella TaxID=5802 RepID=U6L2S7_EIMTE|nr:hypothetical protein ETH_00038335 [Eimeria tenella]CDJ44451.1 hypothetical protein ETH_00038335 [Eimeria tenella]|eukprot:XP_013235200.1 hypothetical protein ETH_00038335 [Eimeria tenella]
MTIKLYDFKLFWQFKADWSAPAGRPEQEQQEQEEQQEQQEQEEQQERRPGGSSCRRHGWVLSSGAEIGIGRSKPH